MSSKAGGPRWDRLRIPGVVLLAGAAAMLTLHAAGVRYNATASVPKGWYVGVDNGGKARVGDFVSFCAPTAQRLAFLPAGDCPGRNARLIKQVVAVGGDVVEVTPSGVRVNGNRLPASVSRMVADLPHAFGVWKLQAGQVWAYGSAQPATSYDSRYFGVVEPEQVVTALWNSD